VGFDSNTKGEVMQPLNHVMHKCVGWTRLFLSVVNGGVIRVVVDRTEHQQPW